MVVRTHHRCPWTQGKFGCLSFWSTKLWHWQMPCAIPVWRNGHWPWNEIPEHHSAWPHGLAGRAHPPYKCVGRIRERVLIPPGLRILNSWIYSIFIKFCQPNLQQIVHLSDASTSYDPCLNQAHHILLTVNLILIYVHAETHTWLFKKWAKNHYYC